MLNSLGNHLITTKINGGLLLVANAEKNRFFTVIKSIAIVFVPAKQVGLDGNIISGDIMVSRNSQSCRVAMIRFGSQIGWAVPRDCNQTDTRMRVPK